MRIHERSRRNVSLALVLFLPLFLASFAAKCGPGKNNVNNGNSTNSGDIPIAVDDLLRSKIRQNLTEQSGNSNTGLSALDIEVGVSKGKVTLSGTARSEAAKAEAKRIAEETQVEFNTKTYKPKEVDVNRLTVTTPSPSP
jgi:hypothetical protein